MNTFFLSQKTPTEIAVHLSQRLRAIRRRRKISQVSLSEKSGVSLGSLKRFEQTGEISLLSLIKLATALGLEDQLDELFTDAAFLSIEEVMNAKC